jgi:hypothetical protein
LVQPTGRDCENYFSQKSVVQKEKTGEKQKILPLTLDMMKVVNERFSLQSDCGGIAGTCVQQGVDPDHLCLDSESGSESSRAQTFP